MFLSRPRQRRTSGDPRGQSAATDLRHASTLRAGFAGHGFAGHGFAGQASARSLDNRGLDDRLRILIPALLAGGISLAALPITAAADPSTDDLNKLRAEIQKEIAALKKQEAKLHQQFLDLDRRSQLLDRKSVLLDEQLRTLRATGTGSAGAAPVGVGRAGFDSHDNQFADGRRSGAALRHRSRPVARRGTIRPGARRPTFAAACRGEVGADPGPLGGTATGPASHGDRADFIERRRRPDPKGQIVLDPSIEYDYWSQNQLGVNGFQIIPGITFGNIFANRVEQNITTAALTGRYGITDRWEVNVKVPYIYNSGFDDQPDPGRHDRRTSELNATGTGIGDIQFGSSYQFNSAAKTAGRSLSAMLLFKTATGISPFDVPIVTVNDPNGEFLEGSPKRLATGTGFYAVEPSLTMLMPTAPGVLFAKLQDIHNLGRTVDIQSVEGGPGTPALPAAWRKPGNDLRHRLFAERPCGDDLQLPATARVYRLRKPSGDFRFALFVRHLQFRSRLPDFAVDPPEFERRDRRRSQHAGCKSPARTAL